MVVGGSNDESSIQNEEFEFSVRVKYPLDTDSTDSTYSKASVPVDNSSPFRGKHQGGESKNPGCEEINSGSSYNSKDKEMELLRLQEINDTSHRSNHRQSNSYSNSSSGSNTNSSNDTVVKVVQLSDSGSTHKSKEVSNIMYQSTAAAENEAEVETRPLSHGLSGVFHQSNLSNSALATHNQRNASQTTIYTEEQPSELARQLFSSELSENSCASSYSGSSFSTIHHSTYRSHVLRPSCASVSTCVGKPEWDSNKRVVHDDSASARSVQPALVGRTMRPRAHPRDVRIVQNQGSDQGQEEGQGQGQRVPRDHPVPRGGTPTRPALSHTSHSVTSDQSKTSSEGRSAQNRGDGDSAPLARSRSAGRLRDTRDTSCLARKSCFEETGITVRTRPPGDSRPYIPPPLPLEIQRRKELENRQMH